MISGLQMVHLTVGYHERLEPANTAITGTRGQHALFAISLDATISEMHTLTAGGGFEELIANVE